MLVSHAGEREIRLSAMTKSLFKLFLKASFALICVSVSAKRTLMPEASMKIPSYWIFSCLSTASTCPNMIGSNLEVAFAVVI